MPAHAKSAALDQHRLGALPQLCGQAREGFVNLQDVIAINDLGPHAVAFSPVGKLLTAVLLACRGGQAVAIILNHKKYRQFPDRCRIECFVKFALTCASFAGKSQGDLAGFA